VDWLELLLLGAVGLVGGVLSGVVGVGGGVIFVPGLVYAGGWQIQEAVAASLVIVVFSSLSGTIRNSRSDDPADWRAAGILSLAVAPASLIGVYIGRVSPETVVQFAFAALLLILAYPTSRGSSEYGGSGKMPLPLVFVAGAFIGVLSGFVGVGGGAVVVPLMVLGMGLETKRAVSTSLVVVMFAALVGALGYIVTGFENLWGLPPLIVGSMAGAWVGVRVRDLLPEGVVRVGFGVLMVVVALHMLAEATGIL
jgi:uncharacterized protein